MSMTVDEVIQSYKMPLTKRGDIVLLYATGQRNGRVEPAVVVDVFPHAIWVKSLVSGMARDCVRHLDDPALHANEDFQREGAWDYTDEHKQTKDLLNRVKSLEKSYEALEAAATKPNSPSPKGK